MHEQAYAVFAAGDREGAVCIPNMYVHTGIVVIRMYMCFRESKLYIYNDILAACTQSGNLSGCAFMQLPL